MGIVAFLPAVRQQPPFPEKVSGLGLERLIYHANDRREAASAIRQTLHNRAPKRHLARQAPVVVLPLEYLELSTHWKAGIGLRNIPHGIFAVEWVFPRADIKTVNDTDLCYNML